MIAAFHFAFCAECLFLFLLAEYTAAALDAIGLACGLAELAEKLLLLSVEVFGSYDVDGDILVTTGRTV